MKKTLTLLGVCMSFMAIAQVKPRISPVIPLLNYSVDSRIAGMGFAAMGPSINTGDLIQNPAKLAFWGEGTTVAYKIHTDMSYSPINLGVSDGEGVYSASFIHTKNKYSSKRRSSLLETGTLGFSIWKYSAGEMGTYDENFNYTGSFVPSDLVLTVGYSLRVQRDLSVGLSLKYINSNLTGGAIINGVETHNGNAVAGDLGFYYRNPDYKFSIGTNFSNVGSKIRYSSSTVEEYLPSNFKFGGGKEFELNDEFKLSILMDVNRSLVPSIDTLNPTTVMGIFQSFNPKYKNNGMKTFWNENMYNLGFEVGYKNKMFARTGFQSQNKIIGNHQYFTMGVGLVHDWVVMDFSYLIQASRVGSSPFSNALRVTLRIDLNKSLQD